MKITMATTTIVTCAVSLRVGHTTLRNSTIASRAKAAAARLGRLGEEPAPQIVQQAVILAEQSNAPPLDINLPTQLRDALQTWNPSP